MPVQGQARQKYDFEQRPLFDLTYKKILLSFVKFFRELRQVKISNQEDEYKCLLIIYLNRLIHVLVGCHDIK